jgi:SNF2 family DNA or RNA helicase
LLKKNCMAVKKSKKKESKKARPQTLSINKKPSDMSLDQWQILLRKQYAEKISFQVKNITGDPIFADYTVYNPLTTKTYRVSIRDNHHSMDFCSCMDFKTNLLGTCKHIEYILRKVLKSRSNQKKYKAGQEISYSSVYLEYRGAHQVKIRIGSDNKTEYERLAKKYFSNENILIPSAFEKFDEFLTLAKKINPDFICYQDAFEFVLDRREYIKRNQFLDTELRKSENKIFGLVKADLFPYQKEGIEFALRQGRCLIADEMGLGKTLQAITAAEVYLKHFKSKKILVITPTSLKYQWSTEIKKFTHSDVQQISGNLVQRRKLYEQEVAYTICTHQTAARDVSYINAADYDMVILDEAQRIKNWKTGISEKLKSIDTKYAIVLTGTPIENKIEELYSVMQMVNPYKLGALFRFLHQHEIIDPESTRIKGYKDLHLVKEILKDSMIRRTKRDVNLQLPARMDKLLFVPMTPEQRVHHDDAHSVVKKLASKWAKQKFISEKERLTLLVNLGIMRMSCDSTYLLDQETRFDYKIEELFNIIEDTWSSNPSTKIVVFSEWERMIRIVSAELESKKIHHRSLSGRVPGDQRSKLIEEFKNNPDCKVFLSTDAGGTGLNLQNASIVVNLDLPWNPAKLEQRIARIYRMGQKKKVQIINMIAKDTIEHTMIDKLHFKSNLAKGILDDGDALVMMKDSVLKDIFNLVNEVTEEKFEMESPSVDESDLIKIVPGHTLTDKDIENQSDKQTREADRKSSANQLNSHQDWIQEDIKPISSTEDTTHSEEAGKLLTDGLHFLSRFIETIQDTKKTESLISSVIRVDESTGKSYLNVPIEREDIEKGLKLLKGILSKF